MRVRPRTALEIAKMLGCCKPTAYARVRALSGLGFKVYTVKVKQQRPGPVSLAYGII